ncbi:MULTISPECIES: hypothetical protein, partial [unclassified Pseudomonas]|uniref:hypothetical protein n=1 Tax=unclassified Pseudomonas TaxID=196821 RepID=UPI001C486FF6
MENLRVVSAGIFEIVDQYIYVAELELHCESPVERKLMVAINALADASKNFPAGKTKPQLLSQLGFRNLILTMTYSHMGKPHTTIGD